MTAAASTRGVAARGRVFWVLLGGLLLLTAIVLGRGSSEGPVYSPRSTGPLGTLALVELLEGRGHDVSLVDAADGVDDVVDDLGDAEVALVVRDQLDAATRAELVAWIRGGGRAIVLDTTSPVVPVEPDAVAFTGIGSIALGSCTIDELGDLDRIESGGFVTYDPAVLDGWCFDEGDGAAVARWFLDDGVLTAVGGASLVSNERLADADNAATLVRLVEGPDPADRRVAVFFDPSLAVGTGSIRDLIPTSVALMFAQALVAAALLVWWQARRFGGVVAEARLVRLPGSLRVRAAAELRRRSGDRETSLVLGRAFERRVRTRHRLPADLRSEQLPAVLARSDTNAAHGPVDEQRFALACGRPMATDSAALDRQLAAIDELSFVLDLDPTRPSADAVGDEGADRNAGDRDPGITPETPAREMTEVTP